MELCKEAILVRNSYVDIVANDPRERLGEQILWMATPLKGYDNRFLGFATPEKGLENRFLGW